MPAERGPSGTGHDTACPECGTTGAAYGTHVCYAGSAVSRPPEPRVTEAAPARPCDHCDGTGVVLEPSRTPEESSRDIPCGNCAASADPPVAVPGPASVSPAEPPRRYYESIIKVNPTDDPARRASHIAEGIGYACDLLMDEYGWSAERIADVLERVTDDVADQEAQRGR